MSVNERWVVYPLLFLTLGVALRDKVVPPGEVAAEQVRCNRLLVAEADCRVVQVAGSNGKGGVRLGTLPDGAGRIEVHGGTDEPLVRIGGGPGRKSGVVETFAPQGVPQVRLLGTDAGGAVAAFDREGNILVLGRAGSQAGLWGVSPHLGEARPLSQPWAVGPEPSPQ